VNLIYDRKPRRSAYAEENRTEQNVTVSDGRLNLKPKKPIIEDGVTGIVLSKLTTDRHEALRGLSASAELLGDMIETFKGKGQGTCYSTTYMSQTRDQQRFTISEVAADWHEPMVPQRIMWSSTARHNGQLDPRCS